MNLKARTISSESKLLRSILKTTNRKYFGGGLCVNVEWAIPAGSVEIRINEDTSYSKVPPAGYYKEKSLIVLHPALKANNAPQYVLRYLIYHECLHDIHPPSNGEMHSERFMMDEIMAPNREKAINWLRENRFPTLPLNNKKS